MILAIDFDGTLIENGYWPEIGPMIPGAYTALQKLHKAGHKIIINSCRAGMAEREMKLWLVANNIPFDAVNENLPERLEEYGEDCRKISADVYIDDKGFGCRIDWPAICSVILMEDEE